MMQQDSRSPEGQGRNTDSDCLQVKADPRASKQFLILAHLYSQKADAASLARLREELQPPRWSAVQMGTAAAVGTVGVVGEPSAWSNI